MAGEPGEPEFRLARHLPVLRRLLRGCRRSEQRRPPGHCRGDALQRLERPETGKPALAGEQWPAAVHAAQHRDTADAPYLSGGGRPGRRWPARYRDLRDVWLSAVRPDGASHAMEESNGPEVIREFLILIVIVLLIFGPQKITIMIKSKIKRVNVAKHLLNST